MTPSSKSIWQQFSSSTLLRFLLLFVSGWAIVVLISFFYNVIAIFTTAAIFAALLNYPVGWLAHRIPRSLAIGIVFLGSIAILLIFAAILGFEILNQGQGLVIQITESLKTQSLLPIKDLLSRFNFEQVFNTLLSSLTTGLGFLRNAFSSVFTLIFVAVISLYMLIDGEKIWLACLKLIPENSRDRFAVTFQHSFLGFLQGQLLLILFLSTASFILFSLLGVNYALLFALIVALLDAIPGIGATLGVVIVTMLVLAAQGWQMALKIAVVSLILQQIQDNFVNPRVMGKTLEISPVMLFFALFIGERVAGLLGVFLAVPIAGMIAAWLKAAELTTPTPTVEPDDELS